MFPHNFIVLLKNVHCFQPNIFNERGFVFRLSKPETESVLPGSVIELRTGVPQN